MKEKREINLLHGQWHISIKKKVKNSWVPLPWSLSTQTPKRLDGFLLFFQVIVRTKWKDSTVHLGIEREEKDETLSFLL